MLEPSKGYYFMLSKNNFFLSFETGAKIHKKGDRHILDGCLLRCAGVFVSSYTTITGLKNADRIVVSLIKTHPGELMEP